MEGAGFYLIVHDILDGLVAGNPDFEELLLLSHGGFLQMVEGPILTGQRRRGHLGVQSDRLGVRIGRVNQFLVGLAGRELQGEGLLWVCVSG